MAKIDFYVLSGDGETIRHQFACRLAEKAYRLKHSVHIYVTDRENARKVDDLLWTFRDGSFVPHEVVTSSTSSAESPVTIGYGEIPIQDCDLLINLGEEVPKSAASFPRVAEVVTSDTDTLARSRQRFVDYREQGHTLETHKL